MRGLTWKRNGVGTFRHPHIIVVDRGTSIEYNRQNRAIEGDPKGPEFLGAEGDTRLSTEEPFSGPGAKEAAGAVSELTLTLPPDDGIDVRLRGVKIKSSRQRELGLNADLFQPTNLVRYPRLEGTDPEVLYRRAVLLQRWLWSWAS